MEGGGLLGTRLIFRARITQPFVVRAGGLGAPLPVKVGVSCWTFVPWPLAGSRKRGAPLFHLVGTLAISLQRVGETAAARRLAREYGLCWPFCMSRCFRTRCHVQSSLLAASMCVRMEGGNYRCSVAFTRDGEMSVQSSLKLCCFVALCSFRHNT